MVYLSRIYTKTGDDGTTSLGDMTRRCKDDTRVEAYGCVDEVNAVLGLLAADVPDFAELPLILRIQNDLFDVGADLCTPAAAEEKPGSRLRIIPDQVHYLEQAIDRLNEPLKPLTSFVLPGGTKGAAWCHLARTICRRAERVVVTLRKDESINEQVLLYLNRLSDLLFVLSRSLNHGGPGDVLWKPGGSR